ncbi:sugar phosphate nucleotidyltransferase [Paenibacillus arenilitoris]|uniref:Glucose-1-phosphate thymidylyltransferase n=1 Tax=Paenibacillus arenilitoris TaxID=2772299 RepID=A0A927CP07_9BACL|nr:sugar phosphate nucleotidyltransferase [Paenibacillus arenilitoris]MBD2871529.1 NTP transferase domain-containing protein [Paenibacillus arenilitoris]
MKGVILAGGTGTRLRPLTNLMNKHLLPVGRFPMIHYGIKKMADAGIKNILLVIGKQSAGLYLDYLGSGKEFGVRLTYKLQDQAGGIAEALSLASEFISTGEKFVVLLGDNLFNDSLLPYVKEFHEQPQGAKVLLKQVPDPRRYGVPIIKGTRITTIIEKPQDPPTSYCVTGIYMYDSQVFELVDKIHPSSRGELEITDVNNLFAAMGTLTYNVLSGWWMDAGTLESLHEAGSKLLHGE